MCVSLLSLIEGRSILIYFILKPDWLKHLSLTSLRTLPSDPDEWTLASADRTVAVARREGGSWLSSRP